MVLSYPPSLWSSWFERMVKWTSQDSVTMPVKWQYIAGLGQCPPGCIYVSLLYGAIFLIARIFGSRNSYSHNLWLDNGKLQQPIQTGLLVAWTFRNEGHPGRCFLRAKGVWQGSGNTALPTWCTASTSQSLREVQSRTQGSWEGYAHIYFHF